jgi:hypothetical protein
MARSNVCLLRRIPRHVIQPLNWSPTQSIRDLLDDFPAAIRLSAMLGTHLVQPLAEDLPLTAFVSATPPAGPHLYPDGHSLRGQIR